jgi:hypothetical protein
VRNGQRSTLPLITVALMVPQGDGELHPKDILEATRRRELSASSAGLWDWLVSIGSLVLDGTGPAQQWDRW